MAEQELLDLRKLLAQGKLVLGTEETLKLLRKAKVQKVLFAANVDPGVRETVERLCRLGNVGSLVLEQRSEEIGALCKKPFGIAVVAVV